MDAGLLEEKVVELNIVEKASDNTIAHAQNNILQPYLEQQWVIAASFDKLRMRANAGFVANMEDVLEVYQRLHDPQRPVVCLDETSKQMIIETRAPIPAAPRRKARHDYESNAYDTSDISDVSKMAWPICS